MMLLYPLAFISLLAATANADEANFCEILLRQPKALCREAAHQALLQKVTSECPEFETQFRTLNSKLEELQAKCVAKTASGSQQVAKKGTGAQSNSHADVAKILESNAQLMKQCVQELGPLKSGYTHLSNGAQSALDSIPDAQGCNGAGKQAYLQMKKLVDGRLAIIQGLEEKWTKEGEAAHQGALGAAQKAGGMNSANDAAKGGGPGGIPNIPQMGNQKKNEDAAAKAKAQRQAICAGQSGDFEVKKGKCEIWRCDSGCGNQIKAEINACIRSLANVMDADCKQMVPKTIPEELK